MYINNFIKNSRFLFIISFNKFNLFNMATPFSKTSKKKKKLLSNKIKPLNISTVNRLEAYYIILNYSKKRYIRKLEKNIKK